MTPSVPARLLLGAGTAGTLGHLPLPGGPVRWTRTNHRGRVVSLASGPALALAAGVAGVPQPAAALAGLCAGALGAYDDVAGGRPEQQAKGLRGHLGALRRGRVTAGTVKLVGLGLTGVAAAALLPGRPTGLDAVLAGGVVAGVANLLNLFDLRPGRALKVGLTAAVLLGAPGPAAAAAVLLPDDLGERTMLGDTGANALGAVLGVALVDRLPARRERVFALAGLAALTAASEVVSYSQVIDAVPLLRALDRLGRAA